MTQMITKLSSQTRDTKLVSGISNNRKLLAPLIGGGSVTRIYIMLLLGSWNHGGTVWWELEPWKFYPSSYALIFLQYLSFAKSSFKLLLQAWERQAAGVGALKCRADKGKGWRIWEKICHRWTRWPSLTTGRLENIVPVPRGEYWCWWARKTQIKGRGWGLLKSVDESLIKGTKSLLIVFIKKLLNIWLSLPKLAEFKVSYILNKFSVFVINLTILQKIPGYQK